MLGILGGASAMAWVTKRRSSDGTLHYQGRYRDPFGAKRTVGTYPSHRQALKAANRAEGKVVDGTWLDPNAGTITFQQYAEDVWLPSRHLEVTTRAGYQSYLRDVVVIRVALHGQLGAVDRVDAFDDVAQAFGVRPAHSGTASARAFAATCGASASTGTTSTCSPSSAVRSSPSAARGNRPRERTSMSTSRSMSASARSCPRATDPKTLTFVAPCLRATRRIRSRLRRSFAILGVRTSRRRGEASAASSRRAPMAASNRSRVSTDGELDPDS